MQPREVPSAAFSGSESLLHRPFRASARRVCDYLSRASRNQLAVGRTTRKADTGAVFHPASRPIIRQLVGFGLRDAAYRLLDAACRVLNEDERAGIKRPSPLPEVWSSAAHQVGREGILTVWDDEGHYVGCLGVKTWAQINPPNPPRPLHGRHCPCGPCKREKWELIDRG